MRKAIPIVVALIFGAAVGLGSSELRWRKRILPYCTVATNAESYNMRDVRVRARVSFSAQGMYVYEDCDPVEALASAVEFEGEPPPRGIADPPLRVADAIIEGEFNAHYTRGCWSPRFQIAARKIEIISPVQSYVAEPVFHDELSNYSKR